MLQVPTYPQRWEEKLAWYKANGIQPLDEGGGGPTKLINTYDQPNGSIDSAMIAKLIQDVFHL